MHDTEIQYFTEAFKLAQDQFYIDAIKKFQLLVDEFDQSDLADDALFNIGLCYYEMSQFQKAVSVFEDVIEKYPDATITALENGNEFGKTAAKSYYMIVQCYIGLDNTDKATSYIKPLQNYTETTYVVKDSVKVPFAQLAEESIKKFNEMKKG